MQRLGLQAAVQLLVGVAPDQLVAAEARAPLHHWGPARRGVRTCAQAQNQRRPRHHLLHHQLFTPLCLGCNPPAAAVAAAAAAPPSRFAIVGRKQRVHPGGPGR